LARSLAALRPLDVEGDIIVDSARGDTVLHTLQHAHCIEVRRHAVCPGGFSHET
jgi:hypothetical protein